jgi:predicted Rossmann fold nucleotide-binding protein DprA/Smf involved in DNA uptake
VLYGAGDAELLSRGGLAIVGSRDADATALGFAHEVAQACAGQGIQVISGGARGVDSEAMLAALGAGGTVVGVLADSLSKQAVAGKYRAALMAGRLVLVSPYDPGSGFSVGNAMGRNKHVYTLANWALVVSTALGEGGTWAGAIEALELGKTPVFVRMPKPAPAAHEALVKQEARPFPEQPWEDLATLLSRTDLPAMAAPADEMGVEQGPDPLSTGSPPRPNSRTAETAGRVSTHDEAGVTIGQDEYGVGAASVYARVLPVMLAHLHEPRDVATLAKELEVLPGQLQAWLDRAIADGDVMKM